MKNELTILTNKFLKEFSDILGNEDSKYDILSDILSDLLIEGKEDGFFDALVLPKFGFDELISSKFAEKRFNSFNFFNVVLQKSKEPINLESDDRIEKYKEEILIKTGIVGYNALLKKIEFSKKEYTCISFDVTSHRSGFRGNVNLVYDSIDTSVDPVYITFYVDNKFIFRIYSVGNELNDIQLVNMSEINAFYRAFTNLNI